MDQAGIIVTVIIAFGIGVLFIVEMCVPSQKVPDSYLYDLPTNSSGQKRGLSIASFRVSASPPICILFPH